MTTNEKYKIDRPVSGDITASNRHDEPQIDKAEFLTRLDTVLDLPKVVAVIWEQYTPYFNDGEECVFTVNQPRIVFEGTENDEDYENKFFAESYLDYGDGYSTGDMYLTKDAYKSAWEGSWPNRHLVKERLNFIADDGTDLEPYWDALSKINKTAEWEKIALLNFGDHAVVRATKSGFDVEFYEHD